MWGRQRETEGKERRSKEGFGILMFVFMCAWVGGAMCGTNHGIDEKDEFVICTLVS